jgi:hypothetical protein
MGLSELVAVLQLSIGPVIVISGVGLVLLSMTNRYGRVIDRSRIIADSLQKPSGNETEPLQRQLTVLMRRARLLRLAIALASLSLLLAAFLIIALFLVALLELHAVALIIILFTSCMVCLIAGLIVFLIDINVSLAALKLEIEFRTQGEA